jgi:hypothetical protein
MNTDYKNQQIEARVDGKDCLFESKYEYLFAQWLKLRRVQGRILDWEYEPHTFPFHPAAQYTPDFRAWWNESDYIWYEVKSDKTIKTGDRTKYKNLQEQYPNEILVVVIMDLPQNPKKRAKIRPAFYDSVRKYVSHLDTHLIAREINNAIRDKHIDTNPARPEPQPEHGRKPKAR